MASYQELIQGSTFVDGLNSPEGSIPRKALHLAGRLSGAINTLFVETGGDIVNSWGQSRGVSETRQAHLVELFTIALKFKTETVTTDCRYNFAIHPAGTTTQDLQADGECDQFWKYATLHVYHGKATPNQFVDALVNPKNFITKEEQALWTRTKYSRAILIRKPKAPPVQNDRTRLEWISNGNYNTHQTDPIAQASEDDQILLAGQTLMSDGTDKMGTTSGNLKDTIVCPQCSAVFTNVGNRNAHERNSKFIK
jgi:hypothetical protein